MSLPVGARTLCITGATLMDPEGLGSGPAQLYIEDGRLVQVGPTVDVPPERRPFPWTVHT